MLTLDVTGTLAKAITPSYGVPDAELMSLRTTLRRHVEDFLQERTRGGHAWSMDPYDRAAVERVRETAVRVKAQRIQTVLWIGIGGSGLGPRVHQETFEGPETVEFLLLDTLDPTVLSLTLEIINWKSVLVVIASKSGSTLEPMSIFALCWDRLRGARGEKAAEHVIAITDTGKGALRDFCIDHGIAMLPIPLAVGGRYSIFTPLGLLPLALFGKDIDAFLRGAKEMDTQCQSTSLDENPAALLASVQYILDVKRGYPVLVIMPYAERLRSFARWDQQLIAESLGKTETHNPIPVSALGTQDQHSLLQQWMAGPRKSWHLFITETEKERLIVPENLGSAFHPWEGKTFGQLLDACYEGTSRALTSAKRPHATITLTRIDEFHLGQLFFFLLVEVVLLGKLYRIDPYGQPAVEIGKQIAREILARGRE